ncbi:MAG: hypothetical protein H8K03_22685 (plasmid) [Nitrospira sp.]
MNKKQWEHLATILSDVANLALVGLALNQVLSNAPFHPWIFAEGLLGCCALHAGALYSLKR